MKPCDVVGAFACGALAWWALAPSVVAQCPTALSCFVIHPTPGCTDGDCCNAICATDPFCCVNQWDGVCVEQALEMCTASVIAGPVVNPTNQNKYYILAASPWSSGQASASSFGGHLVSIADQAENAWVLNMVLANGQPASYWTGLNDKVVEGTFTWVGGQSVSYTSWGPGQPDNFNGIEDAVHVYTTAGQWNDSHSTAMRISVAEVEVYFCGDADAGGCFAVHNSPACNNQECCNLVCALDPSCCSGQWDAQCVFTANAICVAPTVIAGPIVNPATGRRHALLSTSTWITATGAAAVQGATLATIRTAAQGEFIRRTLANAVPGVGPQNVWIGLSDYASEGNFFWAGGVPMTYSEWGPGQPDDWGDEDFVEMSPEDGRWNDAGGLVFHMAVTEVGASVCNSALSCFGAHPSAGCSIESCCNVVCEIDPFCCSHTWDADCASAAAAKCVPNLFASAIVNPATGSAYYPFAAAAWSEAEKFANELGGHLAVPNDAAENTWLTLNFVQSGLVAAPYIGIHDQLKEGIFQAVDSTAPFSVGYSAWAPGEPNEFGGAEDVVQLLSSGLWNDITRFGERPAIIEVPCVGDFDASGAVDAADLAALLGAWGNGTAADVNLDGLVDAADLSLLLGNWGTCATSDCCSSHGTPECDQPACTQCVCAIDPFCCGTSWDFLCAGEAGKECFAACQCGG